MRNVSVFETMWRYRSSLEFWIKKCKFTFPIIVYFVYPFTATKKCIRVENMTASWEKACSPQKVTAAKIYKLTNHMMVHGCVSMLTSLSRFFKKIRNAGKSWIQTWMYNTGRSFIIQFYGHFDGYFLHCKIRQWCMMVVIHLSCSKSQNQSNAHRRTFCVNF